MDHIILRAEGKTAVTPVRYQWSYCSLALAIKIVFRISLISIEWIKLYVDSTWRPEHKSCDFADNILISTLLKAIFSILIDSSDTLKCAPEHLTDEKSTSVEVITRYC